MISAAQCRMARAALQLGVRDLAERARVSTSTITRLEAGEPLRERTVETVQRALEAAGVEFSAGAGRGGLDLGVRLRPEAPLQPHGHTITLAGSALDRRCHVAAFYASHEEEERVMLPFLLEGQAAGNHGIVIGDTSNRQNRLRRLARAGLGLATGAAGEDAAGRVAVRDWSEAHLRGGRFDQASMLALIRETGESAARQGAGLTRIWSSQEWALRDVAGVEDLAEYKSRCNAVLVGYDLAVVCAYDLRKFSAGAVFDILRVHPYVIIAGTLRRNPFFVSTERFLAELHGRRSQMSHGRAVE